MGRHKQFCNLYATGTGIVEYALPGTLVVIVLLGALVTLNDSVNEWFRATINLDADAGTSRSGTHLVVTLPEDFEERVYTTSQEQEQTEVIEAELECGDAACEAMDVMTPVVAGTEVETTGGRGVEEERSSLSLAIQTKLEELADALGDGPEAEAVRQQLRELSNVMYELSLVQTQLAQAIEAGDQEKTLALLKQMNGGTITYIEDMGDHYVYTTVTGVQRGSLIQELRDLRADVFAQEQVQSMPGMAAMLDGLFDLFELDAVATSRTVNGPPTENFHSATGGTAEDMYNSEDWSEQNVNVGGDNRWISQKVVAKSDGLPPAGVNTDGMIINTVSSSGTIVSHTLVGDESVGSDVSTGSDAVGNSNDTEGAADSSCTAGSGAKVNAGQDSGASLCTGT